MMARINVKKAPMVKVKAAELRKRAAVKAKGAKPAAPTSPEALIRKAEEQGYLNSSDILAVYPEAEEKLTQLDDLFTYLQNRDIEVIEDEVEEKSKDAPAEDEFDAEEERGAWR